MSRGAQKLTNYEMCAGCGEVAVQASTALWVPPNKGCGIPYSLCAACTDVKPRDAYEIRERAAARMLAVWHLDHK